MKSFKERLEQQRADKGVLRKRVLPLAAFYGRDADFERRRMQFYSDVAKMFAEEEKPSKKKLKVTMGIAGRGGRKAEVAAIGKERAMPVIINTAPLEYLFSKGMLQGKGDAHGAAYRRLSVGLRLRGIFEGAEISGLKAANWEGSSGGGSPGKLPGDYKMDCIRWLGELRGANETTGLAQSPFSVVEDIVYHDKWLWETVRADRRDRFMLKLHKALDELSVRFHMMAMRDFNARWYPLRQPEEGQGLPDPSLDPQVDQPAPQSPDGEPQSE